MYISDGILHIVQWKYYESNELNNDMLSKWKKDNNNFIQKITVFLLWSPDLICLQTFCGKLLFHEVT